MNLYATRQSNRDENVRIIEHWQPINDDFFLLYVNFVQNIHFMDHNVELKSFLLCQLGCTTYTAISLIFLHLFLRAKEPKNLQNIQVDEGIHFPLVRTT